MANDLGAGRSFLTPAFELLIDGQPIGRRMMADVIDLSFVDDLGAINSFEFSVYDWDPEALEPVYSYPWDSDDKPRKYWDSDDTVPNLLPGAKVSLSIGYRDDGDMHLIMDGEVVSVTTGFPSSGLPVAKIRVLDAFQRDMQTIWVEGSFSGTQLKVIEDICRDAGVTNIDLSAVEDAGSEEEDVSVDGPLFDEVEKRAKDLGVAMVTTTINGAPGLKLVPPETADVTPITTFIWGTNLIDFTPSLSSASQVWEVEGRGADTNAAADKSKLRVVKTWDDAPIEATSSAFGCELGDNLKSILGRGREVIKPDNGTTEEEVEKAVIARFREMAETLITGAGNCVGMPELRAGELVEVHKIGKLYAGTYRITQATHSFGASGYTTSFTGTKLVCFS